MSLGPRLPGQPPSMKVTPRWPSCSATRELVVDREREALLLAAVAARMVSKISTASGSSGHRRSR